MAEADPAIRETFTQFTRAVEATDYAKIMEFFEDDAQMFSPLGALPARLDGRAAIGKQFETIVQMLNQSGNPVKLDPQELSVRDFGTVALLTFHLRLPGPLHRRTFLMRRGPKGWRIAHIHASIASPAQ